MNRFCSVCAQTVRSVVRFGGRVLRWPCIHYPRILVDRRLPDGRYEVAWETEGSNRPDAVGVP